MKVSKAKNSPNKNFVMIKTEGGYQKYIESVDIKSSILVFTDGACTNNGKKSAKAGIGVHFPNKEFE